MAEETAAARPWYVLRDYVSGMAAASTGPDQVVLRRLHDHLRNTSGLVHASYGQIHDALRANEWKLHHNLSPGQIATLGRAVTRVGTAAGDTGLPAPLRPRELASHLRAMAGSEADGDRKESMVRLASFLTRSGTAQTTAPAVLEELGREQWKLEHGMSIEQKQVLAQVAGESRVLAAKPARVRGYADWAALGTQQAVTEAAPRSERWLDRQGELDRLVAASEGSVVVHTDTAGSVPVRYGADRSPGHTGFKTFGDGVPQGTRPDLGYYFTHEPGMHGGFQDPQGGQAHPVEAVTFEPVTKTEYGKRPVTKGRIFRTTTEEPYRIGERPVMVPGPDGPEEAVRFGYAYNQRMSGSRRGPEFPEYTESSGPRDGNMLVVHAVLPRSTAEALGRTIARDPQFARDLAEKLVVERGGLPRDIWEHGKPPQMNRSKPPYERLPADHRIHLIESRADGTAMATPLEWAEPRGAAPEPGPGVERFAQTGGVDGPRAGTAEQADRAHGGHGQQDRRPQAQRGG